jgi:hypothetical protein
MKHRTGPKGGKITASESTLKSLAGAEAKVSLKMPPAQTKSGALPKPASAFDVWLERGLHTLFDSVANEPIPPELLQLIEDDRRKVDDDKAK